MHYFYFEENMGLFTIQHINVSQYVDVLKICKVFVHFVLCCFARISIILETYLFVLYSENIMFNI